MAKGSKLNAKGSRQPSTTWVHEPLSVFALILKLNAEGSVQPSITAVQVPSLKLAEGL